MAQYNLGPLTLTTSIERDMFAVLRQKYFELGKNHQRQFYAHYVSYGSADDLFERLPVDLENVFSETAAMVLHDLAANGIYDVSEKTIRADLEVRVEAVADGFNRVQGRYFDIIGKAAELEAQRQEARENRAQIVGGGFGLEGAARGMALAAVANAAIGLTYGLANLTAKAASDLGDKEKKRQMLQDPATKADISDFLIRIALQGVELVAATVNNGKTLEAVTDEAHERSAAFVENVGAGRVPDNQVQPVLVQALTLDPFNIGAWAEWLDRYGDRDGCIVACAEALGISDVMTHKTKLIAERKAALSWSTPEECRANSVILEQSAEWLGFPFDSERKMIEAKAVRLDRERRTFNGVEYPSLAEAAEASQVHEDKLQRTVAGVVHETLEGANQARALIREQTILASSANTTIGWMTLAYRRYRDTEGRSCRKEFWMFVLSYLIVMVLLMFVLMAVPVPMKWVSAWGNLLFMLASFVTCLMVQIRRFHDQDRSGWFALFNLIPYIGWLIVLAFMVLPGTKGDNYYGPDPR
ncbi:MAG: DUF805 domain-containing protein [Sphingomonadaceae bacterium]|jgi:uncharacterized membrane protein YhaH (DUF805 family)